MARAFAPAELVRLSRSGGNRTSHVLAEPTDRKEIEVRRLLHAQLLPALTAPVVAIVEGPHDMTTYSSAERHRVATAWPLAAAGVRLISADSGSGGGTGQIPRVAALACAMGFRVIAMIDRDPAKTSKDAVTQIEAACDVVVSTSPVVHWLDWSFQHPRALAGTAGTTPGPQQRGERLHQFAGHVEHGRVGDHAGSSFRVDLVVRTP